MTPEEESSPLLRGDQALPSSSSLLYPGRSRSPLLSPPTRRKRQKSSSSTLTQITVLCLLRLCEPIAFLTIFPFVNQMIHELGTPSSKVGYKAGQIEGYFALAEFLTTLYWTSLSDRIGRRPVLIIGLVGVGISAALFGVANRYWWMVVTRTASGALSGYMGLIKTMVGEITTDKDKARAFSLLTISYEVGLLIGPMIGGSLSRPATKYPYFFGSFTFLRKYPYALPCFVSSLFPFAGALLAYVYVEETSPMKKSHVTSTRDERHARLSSESRNDMEDHADDRNRNYDKESTSIWSLFTTPFVLYLAAACTSISLFISLSVIIPLFAFQKIENGGLSFNEQQSGVALTLRGLACVVFQLFLFPPLSKRYGLIKTSKYTAGMFALCYAGMPCVAWVARRFNGTNIQDAIIWGSLAPVLVFGSLGAIAQVSINVLTGEFPPSKDTLATAYGVVQSVGSLSRAVSPIISTSLYTVSLKTNFLGGKGNIFWGFQLLLSIVTFSLWSAVRTPKITWRDRERMKEDGDDD